MDDLVFQLRTRAAIRRTIKVRKSVQEGRPDRLADLLDTAANAIEQLNNEAKGIGTGTTHTVDGSSPSIVPLNMESDNKD